MPGRTRASRLGPLEKVLHPVQRQRDVEVQQTSRVQHQLARRLAPFPQVAAPPPGGGGDGVEHAAPEIGTELVEKGHGAWNSFRKAEQEAKTRGARRSAETK